MSNDQKFLTYIAICAGVWVGELIFAVSLTPDLPASGGQIIRYAGLFGLPALVYLWGKFNLK